MAAPLSGPHPISSKLQIALPTALARHMKIEPGDQFYWRVSDEDPGVLMLIPVEVVERRYVQGEIAERRERAKRTP